MTRKVYADNASRQKAYRERLKKKEEQRMEAIFKKSKNIQLVQKIKTGPIEPSLEAKEFNEEIEEEEKLSGTWIDIHGNVHNYSEEKPEDFENVDLGNRSILVKRKEVDEDEG